MGYQDDFEDEAPHVHQKSHFDTERCPAPTFGEAAALAEMAKPFTPDLSPQERLQLCADSLREVRSVAADFTGKVDDGEPVRVSADGRAAFPPECQWIPQVPAGDSSEFRFPGGVTEMRKPTRDELVTSVIDWSHLAKGYADEIYTEALRGNAYKEPIMALRSAVDRLDAVLKELADATE